MKRSQEFYLATYAKAFELMVRKYIELCPEKEEYAYDYILQMAIQETMFQDGTYKEQVTDSAQKAIELVDVMIDHLYKKKHNK